MLLFTCVRGLTTYFLVRRRTRLHRLVLRPYAAPLEGCFPAIERIAGFPLLGARAVATAPAAAARGAPAVAAASASSASDARLVSQWVQEHAGGMLSVFACSLLRAFADACCTGVVASSHDAAAAGGGALHASLRGALANTATCRGLAEISAALSGLGYEVAEYGGCAAAVLLCEFAMHDSSEWAGMGVLRAGLVRARALISPRRRNDWLHRGRGRRGGSPLGCIRRVPRCRALSPRA